ncbi:probable F-box protein involved in pathogenicity [Cephalotrichum gorgonifer]|uniref:Probable F-box protein involved in pathogenicity n=1 Tax=Cephalotrichum gorgonifer TaxID=2041049 RepID=A0AAE8N3L4_9PEZI|nr:probable F-box protein involved in pathogenicity [Cephalotrichum gorgonifer]
MDPSHITEFASERYFSKLNQLNGSQDPASNNAPSTSTTVVQPAPTQSSPFILPLRDWRAPDEEVSTLRPTEHKRFDRSRLFGLRKVPLLHSKQPVSVLEASPVPPEPVVDHTSHTRLPLDELFRSLPNELQIQIINSLPLSDILNLRRASRSWHTLITLNEAPIVRYHLDHHIPAYALRLYPTPDHSRANFHHLCGLWHRLHVAAKLSYLMCEWITKDIFLRTTVAQRQEFAPQQERMRRRLVPLLFTVFHFFEMYRKLHLEHIQEHGGYGLHRTPYTSNPVELKIMNMYDDKTLLQVHQIFPLVISSFCRQLRPPTYVGRLERSIRGYIREKPSEEVHVAILCLGGLRQVERFWETRGYNNRRAAVDEWYSTVSIMPPEPPPKPKRSFMGMGKKKSMTALRNQFARQSLDDVPPVPELPPHTADGLVFGTSLAAGMPMAPLREDHSRQLLHDLPTLQQIWLTTAEALILDRKIVERPQDILRNAQVMLELIREDGIEEEDEWWYGRNAPDTTRPPPSSFDPDAIESIPGDMIM